MKFPILSILAAFAFLATGVIWEEADTFVPAIPIFILAITFFAFGLFATWSETSMYLAKKYKLGQWVVDQETGAVTFVWKDGEP